MAVHPAALDAQWLQSSVGLGAASVRYAETLETTMVSLTPTVSWPGTRGVVTATGVFASASLQGVLAAALTTSFDAPLAADLTLLTGGSRTDDAVTRQSRVTGRVHLRATRAGLWLGTGVGRVTDGSSTSATRVHDLGAWVDLGGLGVTLTRLPTTAGDTVRFTDTELGVRWNWDRLTLDATSGWRTGTARVSGIDDPGRWRNVTGTLRLSDRVAVVAGAGSYPLDLLQGYPAGRFTTVSLRFTPASAPRVVGQADAPGEVARDTARDTARDSSGLSTLIVQTLDDDRRRLRVRSLGATTIELQGSMTAWASVSFVAEGDGWFAVELAIPVGTHELVLRRDGGRWVVPPGLAVRVDEFGGETGVVVVSR
ncbi:MAG: glycogen-binding domain-containing protein [Gemmatimonadota bacterium]